MDVLVLFLALLGGYWIGRNQRFGWAFQNEGERLVAQSLREHFSSPAFHLLNHVTLHTPEGTTQVDHILVSCFGVFVIETKDYSGWIFAGERDANWTQVLFHHKFRFQNPIRQNFRHICAVRSLLDFLPPEAVQSAVVFVGSAEFKAGMPRGVFTVQGLIDHIGRQPPDIMSLNRVQFCVGRLEMARLALSGETDIEHVESLRWRFRKSWWRSPRS